MNPPEIPLHDEVLNVLLLETSVASIPISGIQVRQSIQNLWTRYIRNSTVEWFKDGYELPSPWEREKQYYNPRIHVCLGAFDISAIYLSPVIGQLFPPATQPRHAGHNILMGILPKVGSDSFARLGVLKDSKSFTDFNEDFIKGFDELAPSNTAGDEIAVTPLPWNKRFVLVAKLKFSASASRLENVDNDHCCQQLARAAHVIAEWKREAESQDDLPQVALALGLGWSEFIVVAHSGNAANLIDLLWRLRCNYITVSTLDDKGREQPEQAVHMFSTTVSHIGYDHYISDQVERHLLQKSDRDGRLSVNSVIDAAHAIAKDLVDKDGRKDHASNTVCICPYYSVYPGHECGVVNIVNDLVEQASKKLPIRRNDGPACFQIGKHDVSGFVLEPEGDFTETHAVTLLNAVNCLALNDGNFPFAHWINGGKKTAYRGEPGEPERPAGPQNFFNVSTHIGLSQVRDASKFALPEHHHRDGRPRRRMSYKYRPEFTLKEEMTLVEAPDDSSIARMISDQIPEIVGNLRFMQVPYSRSEQIVNQISKFDWAANHPVVGEDSLIFAPLIFCLRDFLTDLRSWWNLHSFETLSGPFQVEEYLKEPNRAADEAANRLWQFHEKELTKLMHAMRSNFHQLHMSGYLADLTQDFNLRYRGSVQQLINITNMILDCAVTTLLGDRACVVMIGDSPTPRVKRSCDVIIAELHADVISMPMLLQSLAHEVGHQLLNALDEAYTGAANHKKSVWATGCLTDEAFKTLMVAYKDFRNGVLHGVISESGNFSESTSDYIDLRMLGYENTHEWARDILLRQLMAAQPIFQDTKEEAEELNGEALPLVPTPNNSAMHAAFNRVILVVIAAELRDWAPDEEWDDQLTDKKYHEFLINIVEGPLEEFRQYLYNSCVLGVREELARVVRDSDSWYTYLSKKILWHPWLLDADGADVAAGFYRGLDEYIDARMKAEESTELPVTWSDIATPLRDLGLNTLEQLCPTILVRYWHDKEDFTSDGMHRGRDEITEEYEKANPAFIRPWRAVFQPWSYEDKYKGNKSEKISVEALITQRGRIVPLTAATSEEISRANHKFITQMLSLLAAWRTDLYDRIQRIEETRK